jgi:hypothetical protein
MNNDSGTISTAQHLALLEFIRLGVILQNVMAATKAWGSNLVIN